MRRALLIMLVCFSTAQAQVARVFTNGMVAFVPFENNNANDRYSNVNGIFSNGAAISAGKFGNGVGLNGVNSFVDFGNNAALSFDRSNAFTFCVWLKSTNTTAVNQTILHKFDAAANGYLFRIMAANQLLEFFMDGANGGQVLQVRSVASIPSNQWLHVAMTFNGNASASGVSMYVNGSKLATTTISDTLSSTISNSANFQIGYRSPASLHPFSGYMDNFMPYNRALSDQEIASLANSRRPRQ